MLLKIFLISFPHYNTSICLQSVGDGLLVLDLVPFEQ